MFNLICLLYCLKIDECPTCVMSKLGNIPYMSFFLSYFFEKCKVEVEVGKKYHKIKKISKTDWKLETKDIYLYNGTTKYFSSSVIQSHGKKRVDTVGNLSWIFLDFLEILAFFWNTVSPRWTYKEPPIKSQNAGLKNRFIPINLQNLLWPLSTWINQFEIDVIPPNTILRVPQKKNTPNRSFDRTQVENWWTFFR